MTDLENGRRRRLPKRIAAKNANGNFADLDGDDDDDDEPKRKKGKKKIDNDYKPTKERKNAKPKQSRKKGWQFKFFLSFHFFCN